MKKYIVELTSEERSGLKDIIKAERMAAHKRRHAHILLKAGELWLMDKLTVPEPEPQQGQGQARAQTKSATRACTKRTKRRKQHA